MTEAVQPRPIHVLVVEDDDSTRGALVHLLQLKGFEVTAAGTVADGIAAIDRQHCAVLDLELPDGQGFTILRHIRTSDPSMRVCVLTGSTDAALLIAAKQAGADLVLQKPIALRPLLAWLAAIRDNDAK